MRPPYSQNWNFAIERVLGNEYLLDFRYVGNKGTRLPRMVEANPAVYGPGATAQNADQRRVFAGCQLRAALRLRFSRSHQQRSELDLPRAAGGAVPPIIRTASVSSSLTGFPRASTGFPRSMFPVQHQGLSEVKTIWPRIRSTSARSMGRHCLTRAIDSPSAAATNCRGTNAPALARAFVNGWQLNGIASVSSGTPFTVYDSANVSLQGSAPEITGFYSSRPNLVSDPNSGSHTPNQWVSRAPSSGSTLRRRPASSGTKAVTCARPWLCESGSLRV